MIQYLPGDEEFKIANEGSLTAPQKAGLAKIAALMKQKYAWFVGLGAGCFGLLYFFNGFFLFMK